MASEIKLQALKENVDTVEVNAIKVAPGDVVTKDQPLLEVQADKSALEVPSPVAGRIKELRVKVGDELKIGQVYVIIDAGNGEAAPPQAPSRAKPAAPPLPPAAELLEQIDETAEPTAEEEQHVANAVASVPPPPRPRAEPPAAEPVVPAGPATRRLARTLGVDLRQVHGSADHGRVTEEDVRAFVRQVTAGAGPSPAVLGAQAPPPLPRFEDWGPVDAQPLGAVRKATARQMSLAWGLIPHVTQHDVADVTELEAFRKSQEGKGPKLTVTDFALKAVAIALREWPQFNASLDLAHQRLLLKRYYHIGVAVDTENGLLVPVIRDVDKKGIRQLAEELSAAAQRARDRKIEAEELKGGTFTITNLGGIGGTGFTPIINWPEVAILGMSRSRWEPVVREGQVVPRLMLPLSLSYDHRVIDGAAAARFTRRVASLLEQPLQMLL